MAGEIIGLMLLGYVIINLYLMATKKFEFPVKVVGFMSLLFINLFYIIPQMEEMNDVIDLDPHIKGMFGVLPVIGIFYSAYRG